MRIRLLAVLVVCIVVCGFIMAGVHAEEDCCVRGPRGRTGKPGISGPVLFGGVLPFAHGRFQRTSDVYPAGLDPTLRFISFGNYFESSTVNDVGRSIEAFFISEPSTLASFYVAVTWMNAAPITETIDFTFTVLVTDDTVPTYVLTPLTTTVSVADSVGSYTTFQAANLFSGIDVAAGTRVLIQVQGFNNNGVGTAGDAIFSAGILYTKFS